MSRGGKTDELEKKEPVAGHSISMQDHTDISAKQYKIEGSLADLNHFRFPIIALTHCHALEDAVQGERDDDEDVAHGGEHGGLARAGLEPRAGVHAAAAVAVVAVRAGHEGGQAGVERVAVGAGGGRVGGEGGVLDVVNVAPAAGGAVALAAVAVLGEEPAGRKKHREKHCSLRVSLLFGPLHSNMQQQF